jgi:hypothetical protein
MTSPISCAFLILVIGHVNISLKNTISSSINIDP